MSECRHERTKTGEPRSYTGSVAIYSSWRGRWLTEQNRAAHGGIAVTITCLDCGATRQENRNGRHVEMGPWWSEDGYEG
jgi:hypothetical protein